MTMTWVIKPSNHLDAAVLNGDDADGAETAGSGSAMKRSLAGLLK
jgi:hypothetical protein